MIFFKKAVALLLTMTVLTASFSSCISHNDNDDDTSSTTSDYLTSIDGTTAPDIENDTIFNIVYALATVPPVLAAIECISSGYETYAIVERGKTYSGIDKLEYFHNAGFDTGSNASSGLAQDKMDAMVSKVKELNEQNENAFFIFYAQDGTALSCAAIAANAGVKSDRFHVYMCEDGTGAYVNLKSSFIEGKVASEEADAPYEAYAKMAEEAKERFNDIMSKDDNKSIDEALIYNIPLAFALASLPNFTYYLQEEANVNGIVKEGGNTLLLSAFGIGGYTGEKECEYKLNLKYQKIADGIASLSEEERTDYLILMYGDYYKDTYETLTRTERCSEAAPEKKLVFIGTRYSYYPQFASDATFGIGGLGKDDIIADSYDKLDEKYKNALLFSCKEDYDLFLSIVNDQNSYVKELSEAERERIKVEAFNLYIDYIFTLKFAYSMYGEEYDIVMKGHPMEVLGNSSEWGNRYKVTFDNGEEYSYDLLLDTLLLAFHDKDSCGKYIGNIPYGTAAENLAYLGIDISIGGLPSSTYSGMSTDVGVVFIMAATNESITGDVSQVKERYLAGTLTYGNGEVCSYYNMGNIYKYGAEIFKGKGDNVSAEKFGSLFSAWLLDQRSGAKDIDGQGFAKEN